MKSRIENIESAILAVSNKLKWKDIELWCNHYTYNIQASKKGYKVYIKSSVWSVHLEHRISDELKFGIIRELRKILIKEQIIKQ